MIKTCYNNGQKERLCLIIDKFRRQKLCKRAQKISAAAPLRTRVTLASKRAFRVLLLELVLPHQTILIPVHLIEML